MTTHQEVADTMIAHAADSGDIPQEMASVLRAFLPEVESDKLSGLMADAATARDMMSRGDKDGAREIVGRYRDMAVTCGFEALYDQMFADIME